MRICATVAMALGTAVMLGGHAFAHHSFAGEFDNSVAVNISGVVTSVEMVNPHSWIYLDVETDGAVERWALEGPGPFNIQRRQGDLTFIKPGAELGACGYLARADVTATKREPGTGKAARKLQAAVLTTAVGVQLVWNNYGQGKCGLDR
jgi:hypothetical protein